MAYQPFERVTREGTSASGGSRDIGAWWQDILTDDEIRTIMAAQEAQIYGIQEASRLNWEILGLAQDLFNRVGGAIGTDGASIPSQYNEAVDLFRAGGEYGQGARAEIERGAQQALASGQLGLATTGMSSGTNAAGLTARVNADRALANAGIEDQRIQALSGALTQAGGAQLTVNQQAITREGNLLNALSSLNPRYVNY